MIKCSYIINISYICDEDGNWNNQNSLDLSWIIYDIEMTRIWGRAWI